MQIMDRVEVDRVITDVDSPGMSGAELATLVASKHPGTRILAISGYPEERVLNHPGHPIQQLLAKPFSLSKLHGKVCELLSGKKPACGVSSF
jgi:response regulator RpfG family c-di-GMP phosphodiesterase